MKTKYTDYENSLTNVSSSICKHFGLDIGKKTIPSIDHFIQNKKKIVLMLLDGMGENILNLHLNEDSFLRKKEVQSISSCFPPTTAAATTSLLSGLNPIESGWLGWHLYLSSQDPSLILFRNVDYYSGKKYDKINVNEKIGYESILDKISKQGVHTYSIYPSFMKDGYKTMSDALEGLKKIISMDDPSFTYFYWDCPDALIHEAGTNGDSVHSFLLYVNEQLASFSKTMDKDTGIILLADHGLIDVEAIDITKMKDLTKMLRKKMSGEGRCPIFHVKKKELANFRILFDYYFGDYFDLYSKEEVLKSGLFGEGKMHPSLKYSLGDYVAVATDHYYLTTDLDFVFKGHHAGGKKEESEIPLIFIG